MCAFCSIFPSKMIGLFFLKMSLIPNQFTECSICIISYHLKTIKIHYYPYCITNEMDSPYKQMMTHFNFEDSSSKQIKGAFNSYMLMVQNVGRVVLQLAHILILYYKMTYFSSVISCICVCLIGKGLQCREQIFCFSSISLSILVIRFQIDM